MKREKKRKTKPYIQETVVREHRNRIIKQLFLMAVSGIFLGAGAAIGFYAARVCLPKEMPVMMTEDAGMELYQTESDTEQRDVPEKDDSGQNKETNDGNNPGKQIENSLVLMEIAYAKAEEESVIPLADAKREYFGLIIAEDEDYYYLLTASDYIKNAEAIKVLEPKIEAEAWITLDTDQIGLITVDKADLKQSGYMPVVFGKGKSLQSGESVFAAGCPYFYAGSVGAGIVTAIREEIGCDYTYTRIYTDMPANQESRGVVLDKDGRIVGWMVPAAQESLNAVISVIAIEDLNPWLHQLLEGEKPAALGIFVKEVTVEDALWYEIPRGLCITGFSEQSAAKNCGMQQGDILTAIDGNLLVSDEKETNDEINDETKEATGIERLKQCLQQKAEDETVLVTFERMGPDGYEQIELEIELHAR